MTMSKINDWSDFRIDWDLHELGPKPKPLPQLHGPKDATLHALAIAIAAGDVPPNAPVLVKGKAA